MEHIKGIDSDIPYYEIEAELEDLIEEILYHHHQFTKQDVWEVIYNIADFNKEVK